MDRAQVKSQIKELARAVGFSDCGIAPAGRLSEDADRLRKWLNAGMHAGMNYMENHFHLRTDPSQLVPQARSCIILLLSYNPSLSMSPGSYRIARYAYGKDYHRHMKKKLRELATRIESSISPLKGRVFVDSAPVLERSLAAIAGLGWIGKNGNLISPRFGSYVFIGEIISDLDLTADSPISDHCGGCTKCLQACPTGAIVSNRIIDSNKCISYWTIEHRGPIRPEMKGKFDDWIFGCDICQEVCPWNRKAEKSTVQEFRPSPDLLGMTKENWRELTEERFGELFAGSAVNRTKYSGLLRNIQFLNENPDRNAN